MEHMVNKPSKILLRGLMLSATVVPLLAFSSVAIQDEGLETICARL